MKLSKIFAVLLLCLFGLAAPVMAQSDRATILGTVRDASSALLPDVTVQVTNVGTGAVVTTKTNKLGIYRVNGLPIGSYSVNFSRNGFQSEERTGIVLLISQVAEIDAKLPVGVVTQTLVVNAAAPLLQTDSSVVSANLNNQAVSELPINVQGGRVLSNFMFAYLPGVEGSDYSSHIDGGVAFTKEVLIDGTSAVSQLGGYTQESQPPMESVQEFETDTVGISADAGRSGGGVFKYELKSGTNKMHGSLFGFMHSTDLDALSASQHLTAHQYAAQGDALDEAAALAKSDSLSDWGGSFGSAIVKNKLFYYLSFERYMQAMWGVGANSRIVPTDAMMGLDASSGDPLTDGYADLSPMLTTGDVLTTAQPVNPDGTCNTTAAPVNVYLGSVYMPGTGCVFANNQIPTSLISKTTAKILQLYHKYYQPDSQTLIVNEPGPSYNPDPWFHNTQSSLKMDYYISQQQHIAGSFYWNDYPRINADQGGVWSTTAPDGGPMANSYWHDTTAPGARLSDAITITPNLLNTVYGTFNRFRVPSLAVSQSGNWDSNLGLMNGAGNFPLVYFETGEYTNGADYQNGWAFSPLGSQFNDTYVGNTFIYSDELVWSHGRQNIKAGVEFRAMQMNYTTDNGTFMGGYPIIFDPSTTSGYGYQETGNAFGSFLLGDVYNAESNNPDNEYGRRKAFSWYASDDIKVNQRLTINVSLRWDYNNPYKEKYGRWSSFEIFDKNPVSGEMGTYEYLTSGKQSFERRQDNYNYAPHLGVAYKINDKTVVRGNIGVFFSPLNLNQWGGVPYQQAGNVGFHDITQESNFNWDGGYNPTLVTPSTPGAKSPVYLTSDVISIDPRSLTPGNTQQYSVGVQRELDQKTRMDVNWIQSRSTHLQSGTLETDQPTVANMQAYELHGTFPASYVANPYFGYGDDGWQGITPYPQVYGGYTGPLLSVGAPLGNTDYKSMQISFTRRAAHGLSFMGSYNWSRTHGDVDSDFQEPWGTGSIQNIYDLKNEAKGISDFDETHVVKGYVLYDLPFGRGKQLFSNVSRGMNAAIGGWSLAGDWHYNTGTPISVHATNYYPGFNSVYIDLVPGCKLTESGQHKLGGQWLNPACFQNPANGYLGTGGNFQAQVRNPGMAIEDLGLHKALTVDRVTLALRMEFFNLFNRHELGGPDTNKGDSTFGQILGYGGPGGRVGQFGARLTF